MKSKQYPYGVNVIRKRVNLSSESGQLYSGEAVNRIRTGRQLLTYNLTVLHLQFCDFEEKKHAITLYYIYNIYIIYIVYKYTHFMLE